MEVFAIVIAILANSMLEAMIGLILFSMLIVQVWPKAGYGEASDFSGKASLLVMHAGIVIFKLAALFVFALFALVILFAGFIFAIGTLSAFGN